MGVKRLPSGRYRLQIRRKGVRVDEVFATETEARKALQQYTGSDRRGKRDLTLDDTWLLYSQSLDFVQKRPGTQHTESSRIKRVLRHLGPFAVSAITSESVENYITDRLKDDPAPSADAVRLEVAALSAVLNFARKRSLIAANPCIGVRRPTAPRKLRRLSSEDEGSLMALQTDPNPRFRYAARLCLLVRETGARPGEWAKARFQDFDFEKGIATFPETKYKTLPRTVPLTAAAVWLLLAQMEDLVTSEEKVIRKSNYLFPAIGKDGTACPMHYTGALRDAKKHGRLKKHIRAHTGRHEFISTLVEASSLDDSRIMSLVGHHSPASMEIYKHVRNVQFRPQIEEIEPERRAHRLRAFGSAVGMSNKRLEALLIKAREGLTALGKEDEGEELLYSREFLDEVMAAVKRPRQSLDTRSRAELINLIRLLDSLTDDDAESPPDSQAILDALEGVSLGDRVASLEAQIPSERRSTGDKEPRRKSGKQPNQEKEPKRD